MKAKLTLLVTILSVQLLISQNYQTIEEVNDACATLGFSSNEDAEIAVDKILDGVGLFRNFVIQECPDINNAVAKVIEISKGYKERYILYDGSFFSTMDNKANTDWASMSILAHEIGHHLNGHSLNDKGSNHAFELEADFFSGSALAKLGATLEEAQSAIRTLKYEKATATHPSKINRLAAIETGWKKASKYKIVEVNSETKENIELFDYDAAKIDQFEKMAFEAHQAEFYSIAASNFLKAFQYSNGQEFSFLYNTASSYISDGDNDSALKYFLFLIRKGIDKLGVKKQQEIYKNIGLIYVKQNRSGEAIKFFDFALRNNKYDEVILMSRAQIYYNSGDIKTYKNELLKILKINPNNSQVLYNLGVITINSGDLKEGINYYEQCLFIDPQNKSALINISAAILSKENEVVEEMNRLGTSKNDDIRYDELRIERGNIHKAALIYLEKYITLDKSNKAILDTAANIYLNIGDEVNYRRIKRLQN